MKRAFLTAALCIVATAASGATGPVARFGALEVENSSRVVTLSEPTQLSAGPFLLSDEAPSMLAFDDPGGAISAEVVLDYTEIAEGDIAGLAVWQDSSSWISIQVEPIEPADLIAVRVHEDGDLAFAGRLLATAPLPGGFGDQVRLRLSRIGDGYSFAFAPDGGPWQPLGRTHRSRFTLALDPSGPSPQIVLHAFDGAARN